MRNWYRIKATAVILSFINIWNIGLAGLFGKIRLLGKRYYLLDRDKLLWKEKHAGIIWIPREDPVTGRWGKSRPKLDGTLL